MFRRMTFCLAAVALSATTAMAARPIDVTSKDRVSNLLIQTSANDHIHVAWRTEDGRLFLSHFEGQGWQQGDHILIPPPFDLGLLGGFTRDEAGNSYLLTAKQERATKQDNDRGHRPGIINIVKVPAGSRQPEILADLNNGQYCEVTIFSPLVQISGNDCTSSLVHSNGVLVAAFGHNHNYDPGVPGNFHQRGIVIAVHTDGRSAYKEGGVWNGNYSSSHFSSHNTDIRVFPDGDNFIVAESWENQTVGLRISHLNKNSRGGYNWTNGTDIFTAAGNKPYYRIRIGGFARTPYGHALVFTHGNAWTFSQHNKEHSSRMDLYFAKLPRNGQPEVKHYTEFSTDTEDLTVHRCYAVGGENSVLILGEIWKSHTLGRSPIDPPPSYDAGVVMRHDHNNGKITLGRMDRKYRFQKGGNAALLPDAKAAVWLTGQADAEKLKLYMFVEGTGQVNIFDLPTPR